MWGWTVLLVWADRKPVERRGVLLLTAVPVIPAILLNMLHQWAGGFVPFAQIAPWFFFLIGLMSLFAFSFFYASPAKEAQPVVAAR